MIVAAVVVEIVLAIVLLNEQRELGLMFYLGVAIILAGVFAHPVLVHRAPGKPAPELLGTAPSRSQD
jgi:hypothetical protein